MKQISKLFWQMDSAIQSGKLLLSITLLLTSLHLFSQSDVDSLKRLLNPNKHDTLQLNILLNLVELTPDGVWEEYNDRIGREVAILKNAENSDVRAAAKHYEAAYLGNLAFSEFNKGNVQFSLECRMKSLKIYEEQNRMTEVAAGYAAVGFIFRSQDETALALKYYSISYEMYDKLRNDDGKALALNNIGSIYDGQARNLLEKNGNTDTIANLFQKALANYQLSLELHIQEKDQDGIASSNNNIGALYANLFKLWKSDPNKQDSVKRYAALSLECHTKSLAIWTEMEEPRGIAIANTNLGRYYFYQGEMDKAEEYAERGHDMAKEFKYPGVIRDSGKLLASIYKAKGKYKEALAVFEEYISIKDSLQNDKLAKAAFQKKYDYEYAKKTAADSVRIVEKEKIVAAERKQERTQRWALIVGIIFFALLVIGLRWNIQQRKNSYEKLQAKNLEIQTQSEKLVKQSREIARYQSQMNPHFVFNALNSIQGHVMNDEKNKTVNQLQVFSKLMRQTLNNSDNELIALSTEFEFLKLYFAFEKERFQKEIQFEISSNTDNENVLIPPMLIQPFIENALKHAGLDHVDSPRILLQIQEQNELLLITVSDNGTGMKTDFSLRTNKPHATEIVRSRIHLLFENQKMVIPETILETGTASGFSSGTEVRLTLPLINRF